MKKVHKFKVFKIEISKFRMPLGNTLVTSDFIVNRYDFTKFKPGFYEIGFYIGKNNNFIEGSIHLVEYWRILGIKNFESWRELIPSLSFREGVIRTHWGGRKTIDSFCTEFRCQKYDINISLPPREFISYSFMIKNGFLYMRKI